MPERQRLDGPDDLAKDQRGLRVLPDPRHFDGEMRHAHVRLRRRYAGIVEGLVQAVDDLGEARIQRSVRLDDAVACGPQGIGPDGPAQASRARINRQHLQSCPLLSLRMAFRWSIISLTEPFVKSR